MPPFRNKKGIGGVGWGVKMRKTEVMVDIESYKNKTNKDDSSDYLWDIGSFTSAVTCKHIKTSSFLVCL